MKVRPTNRDDAEAIASLLAACAQTWTRAMVEAELHREAGICVVGEEAGALAGAVLGWVTFDVAELAMIAVHPAHQRRGSGRALLDEWQRRVCQAGAHKVWLEVRASNAAAIALYEGAGYRRTGIRPRYYKDGEDALLMEAPLVD